eukprot:1193400-Prorocentrum_minimum.AAC.3
MDISLLAHCSECFGRALQTHEKTSSSDCDVPFWMTRVTAKVTLYASHRLLDDSSHRLLDYPLLDDATDSRLATFGTRWTEDKRNKPKKR